MALAEFAEGFGSSRSHHITADQQIGTASNNAYSVELLRVVGNADVGIDSAVLLRQAGDIKDRNAAAFEVSAAVSSREQQITMLGDAKKAEVLARLAAAPSWAAIGRRLF